MEKMNRKREQLMEAAMVVFTRDGI